MAMLEAEGVPSPVAIKVKHSPRNRPPFSWRHILCRLQGSPRSNPKPCNSDVSAALRALATHANPGTTFVRKGHWSQTDPHSQLSRPRPAAPIAGPNGMRTFALGIVNACKERREQVRSLMSGQTRGQGAQQSRTAARSVLSPADARDPAGKGPRHKDRGVARQTPLSRWPKPAPVCPRLVTPFTLARSV
jgi:hypothetical protein